MTPPAIAPATVLPAMGADDEDVPRLQITAAHPSLEGVVSAPVRMAGLPVCSCGCESIDPGTRLLTARTARVISSQRHVGATYPG